MDVLLISPPLVQINTPYPATQFLLGYLDQIGVKGSQRDLGIELVLTALSRKGLQEIFEKGSRPTRPETQFFFDARNDVLRVIDDVILFLQGKNPTLAFRIAGRTLVPEGGRFASWDASEMPGYFGTLGVQDQAKHIASLFIDDCIDYIQDTFDPWFSLSKYGDKLAASHPHFDDLNQAAYSNEGMSPWLDVLTDNALKESSILDSPFPVVGITVPFPGCMLGALKIGRRIKSTHPRIQVVIGGGYVNTELRSLKDVRIFDFVDAIVFDDGEKPFQCFIEYAQGKRQGHELLRTMVKENGEVKWVSDPKLHDVPQNQTGFPTLRGLDLDRYVSMVEMLNPMNRFWTDLRWNKMMLAHGCYWKKCSFCDVTLDYIGRYEPSGISITLERMKRLAQESGSGGFHFIDEAAPPAVLKHLAQALIDQQLNYTWWGNIRFDKVFDQKTTDVLADSGCVAVSGGLEAASDRLLKKMNKGVTVEQVARVTKAFRNSGVMVHAYLMYGFPGQTTQETIDALERVRQLFAEGCLSSAFWHRFSATVHSPVGKDPESYGVELHPYADLRFAENDIPFTDPTPTDHDALGVGLRKALYNFMLGIGLDADVREWFDFQVPKTTVPKSFIKKAIRSLNSIVLAGVSTALLAASLLGTASAYSEPFHWCVATASHQIEGDNFNSDWWAFEQKRGAIKNGDTSKDATRSWDFIDEDIRNLKSLGVTHYRFSIEWAKIETTPGVYNSAMIQRYRDFIQKLKANGIESQITLHHFTLPRFISDQGGWENPSIVPAFQRYVEHVVPVFQDLVRDYITLNEPTSLLAAGYVSNVFPPAKNNPASIVLPTVHFLKAHALAYQTIHRLDPDARVGIAHHLRVFDALRWWNPLDHLAAWLLDQGFNWSIPDALENGLLRYRLPTVAWATVPVPEAKGTQDFFGLNYYSRDRVALRLSKNPLERSVTPGAPVTDLNWEIYPEGFYRLLKTVSGRYHGKPSVPILVLENGLADATDQKRSDFLDSHLRALKRAKNEGVPVQEFCHWTLNDNFEWAEGYSAQFGFFSVDRKTFKRTPRTSARTFRSWTQQQF